MPPQDEGGETMAVNQNQTLEQQKKAEAERLWLSYFNDTLFKQGLITEQQRNKLQNNINLRKSRSHDERSL